MRGTDFMRSTITDSGDYWIEPNHNNCKLSSQVFRFQQQKRIRLDLQETTICFHGTYFVLPMIEQRDVQPLVTDDATINMDSMSTKIEKTAKFLITMRPHETSYMMVVMRIQPANIFGIRNHGQ
jgi:hypothetical protein